MQNRSGLEEAEEVLEVVSKVFASGIRNLYRITTRFIRYTRVQQVVDFVHSFSGAYSEVPSPSDHPVLRSTAFITRGLTELTRDFHRQNENQAGWPRIIELDEQGHELPIRLLPLRRDNIDDIDLELGLPRVSQGLQPLPGAASRRGISGHIMPFIQGALLINALFEEMNDRGVVLPRFNQDVKLLGLAVNFLVISSLAVDLLGRHNSLAPARQNFAGSLANNVVLPRPAPRPQPNLQRFFVRNPAAAPLASLPRALPLAPRNDKRLSEVGFPQDLIPEEFTCALMDTVMDNPVRLPVVGDVAQGQVCDGASVLAALARKAENPFNRQPMTQDDVKPELGLRNKIGSYVDYVVEGVDSKRRELGRDNLSHEEYKTIHEAAMGRIGIQDQADQTSPPAATAPRMG